MRILTPEDRERERTLFEKERKRVPELFERPPMIDNDAVLRSIGISMTEPNRPLGYLKLSPPDFVVEEVASDRSIYNIEVEPLWRNLSSEGPTLYADLVKLGVSTLEAKNQLAHALGLGETSIGFAGIKDRAALTSQRISIRNLPDVTRLESLSAENFFLKNAERGKGVIANGDLYGNRFLITVRTSKPFDPQWIASAKEKVTEIAAEGFWNFFYTQRFGTPRLISHLLGLLLLKTDYEAVIRTFLTYTAPREIPYFKEMRDAATKIWGNWQAIRESMERFPYHFHLELTLLDHLVAHPNNFLGALQTIPDQIRLWMYAYDSFLYNRKLSEHIGDGDVPLELPFTTSFQAADWEPYREFLDADEITLPSRSWRDFSFIRVQSRACQTLQKIEIHGTAFEEKIAVFFFSLPKGSYATSFLMNFFMLASGLPIPSGIPTHSLDAKEILGLGTLKPTLERFRTVLERIKQDQEDSLEG